MSNLDHNNAKRVHVKYSLTPCSRCDGQANIRPPQREQVPELYSLPPCSRCGGHDNIRPPQREQVPILLTPLLYHHNANRYRRLYSLPPLFALWW